MKVVTSTWEQFPPVSLVMESREDLAMIEKAIGVLISDYPAYKSKLDMIRVELTNILCHY